MTAGDLADLEVLGADVLEDGAGRAAETVMAALLARFLKLSEAEAAIVVPRTDFSMKNWNGIEVGRMRTAL